MSTGLFIGRFQPLHLGHVSAIEKALRENNSLVIGIGSSQFKMMPANPFAYSERVKMIKGSVKGRYKIFPVADINDDDKWVGYVKACAKRRGIKRFDIIYSNNSLVLRLFRESGYDAKRIPVKIKINSTKIRKLMAEGKPWKKYVPEGAVKIIENIRGQERVRRIYKSSGCST